MEVSAIKVKDVISKREILQTSLTQSKCAENKIVQCRHLGSRILRINLQRFDNLLYRGFDFHKSTAKHLGLQHSLLHLLHLRRLVAIFHLRHPCWCRTSCPPKEPHGKRLPNEGSDKNSSCLIDISPTRWIMSSPSLWFLIDIWWGRSSPSQPQPSTWLPPSSPCRPPWWLGATSQPMPPWHQVSLERIGRFIQILL